MPTESKNNKRIAKNSIFLSIRMLFVLVIGLYSSRIILQVLGVEDYGVYNVVCGFVSIFSFLNSSMSTGIQRFFNYELGKSGIKGANRVYNMAMLIQLILIVIVLIFSETLGLWYLYNKMVIPEERFFAAFWIYQLSILNFIFIILEVPYKAAILAHEKINFFAFVSIVDVVLKLAIIYLVPLVNGDNLIVYGILFTSVGLLNLLASYIYSKRNFSEIYFCRYLDSTMFKSMLGFSGWNVLGTFSIMMREQGVNLVLNLFFGPIVNAARAIAVQVNSGLLHVVRNITIPVRPQVIQSYASGNIKRTLSLTYSISKLSFLFLYLVAMPVLIEIDYILYFWLGDGFPEHTSGFVVAIVVSSFFHNFYMILSDVAHATGNIRKYQIYSSIMIVLSVPLAYIVLKLDASPEFAMWMTVVSMIAAFFMALKVLRSMAIISIKDYFKEVIAPVLLVVITTIFFPFIPYMFYSSGFNRFLLTILFSSVPIMVSIYFFGLNVTERDLIKGMVLSLIKKKHKDN